MFLLPIREYVNQKNYKIGDNKYNPHDYKRKNS